MQWTEEEKEQLKKAVGEAEKHTNGEIRMYLEAECTGDPLAKATELFMQHGMDKTEQRNGTLIYVATKSHKLAIVGDKGINELVDANFWDSTRLLMTNHFKEGRMLQGLLEGIAAVGKQLEKFFPKLDDNPNELPDDIILG